MSAQQRQDDQLGNRDVDQPVCPLYDLRRYVHLKGRRCERGVSVFGATSWNRKAYFSA